MEDQLDEQLEWIKLRKDLDKLDKERTVKFGGGTQIFLDNPLIEIGMVLSTLSFFRGLSVISDDKKTLKMMFSRIGFQAIAFGAFAYALHQKIKLDVERYKEIDEDKLYI